MTALLRRCAARPAVWKPTLVIGAITFEIAIIVLVLGWP